MDAKLICGLAEHSGPIGWAALSLYAGVEAYLGKTTRVQAGSVLELIWNLVFKRKPKE